jgi:hypothetical protein
MAGRPAGHGGDTNSTDSRFSDLKPDDKAKFINFFCQPHSEKCQPRNEKRQTVNGGFCPFFLDFFCIYFAAGMSIILAGTGY